MSGRAEDTRACAMRDAVEGARAEGESLGQLFEALPEEEPVSPRKSEGGTSSSMTSRRAQTYTGPFGSLVALHGNLMRGTVNDDKKG